MIQTKSILVPKESFDGTRISVMSRHTLNDGSSPHPKITIESYDEWLRILSPRPRLIGDYYKRSLGWERFEEKYLLYIRQPEIMKEIEKLSKRGIDSNVTLLCIEDSPNYCHRRLIAEECKRYNSSLEIRIN